jgi:hypothetical protein
LALIAPRHHTNSYDIYSSVSDISITNKGTRNTLANLYDFAVEVYVTSHTRNATQWYTKNIFVVDLSLMQSIKQLIDDSFVYWLYESSVHLAVC